MGEIGLRLGERLSAGLLVSFQRAEAEHDFGDATNDFEIDRRISATSVCGTVAARIGTAGFLVGADAGVALGQVEFELHFRDSAAPANDLDLIGDWDGNAFTGSLFVGFDRPAGEGFSLFARLGYRFQNLGELDGGYTSPQAGSQPGPPLNGATAEPMDTDLSGIYVLAGIGFGG